MDRLAKSKWTIQQETNIYSKKHMCLYQETNMFISKNTCAKQIFIAKSKYF